VASDAKPGSAVRFRQLDDEHDVVRERVVGVDPARHLVMSWTEELSPGAASTPASRVAYTIGPAGPVSVKRAYGLKSADCLWVRLILDLNRAKDVVLHTVEQDRELVAGFRAIFSGAWT
jgi:hypothetical protein